MSKKIMIAYIISSLSNKGPTNILYSIIKGLNREKFIPIVFTLKPETNNSRFNEFKALNIKIINSNNRKEARKKIKNYLLKSSECVILHSHGIFPDIINRSFIHTKNAINITTLHDYMFEDYILTYGKIMGHIMTLVHTWAIKPIYKISCSETVQKKLNYYNHIQTDAIQNGVPYRSFRLNPNAESKPKHLLYLGNISGLKNIDFLIKAFIKAHQPNLILDLVGEGELLSKLQVKYSNYDNVKFWGHVNDPSNLLSTTDYLVSASKSEGLPTAVLEALSYGKPLLLSNIENHEEILAAGNFGFCFINNNLESFAQNLKKLLSVKFDAKEIREQARKKFSATVMSKKYQERYTRLYERN